MARVKRGVIARARHKKILKQAKGYYGARSRVYRVAFRLLSKLVSMLTVTVVNVSVSSGQLWIARINAAARQNGISYSKFINGLKKPLLKSTVRSPADIAVFDKVAFTALVEKSESSSGISQLKEGASLPFFVSTPSKH